MDIVKTYTEHLPAARLIGRRYTDADRVNGGFGTLWMEWITTRRFAPLETLPPLPGMEDASWGLMGCRLAGADFEYWIGMMFPAGTAVPEGYACVDLPEGDVGICWIRGTEESGELYGMNAHNACMEKIRSLGRPRDDFKPGGWTWFFERYVDERFNKDEQGRVILDYGVYIDIG